MTTLNGSNCRDHNAETLAWKRPDDEKLLRVAAVWWLPGCFHNGKKWI